MEPLTAAIITLNEERNIGRALEGVAFADEVVVVDSGSTDRTVEICRRAGAKVFQRPWTGFVDQKNHAASVASHDWILSLDADERPSARLAEEIAAQRRSGFSHPGYRIPRVAHFMGRWIRHGDWYPDPQLRLFDRRRARWQGGRVHESVRLDGTPGMLSGEIEHFTYRTLSDYLVRLDRYSALAAADRYDAGRRATAWRLAVHPPAAFLRNYVLKLGLLDGVPGLMVAVMSAISVWTRTAKLYELQHGASRAAAGGAPAGRSN